MASIQATVRGQAIGAIFLGGFGTAWLVNAAAADGAGIISIGALSILGLILMSASVALMHGLPVDAEDGGSPEHARMRRWFIWANVTQYTAIGAVMAGANAVARRDLIAAGISIVVALHFIPLAYVFRNPLQYGTAACVLAWDMVWLMVEPRASMVPVSAGTGAMLWITGAAQLRMGHSLRGRRAPSG